MESVDIDMDNNMCDCTLWMWLKALPCKSKVKMSVTAVRPYNLHYFYFVNPHRPTTTILALLNTEHFIYYEAERSEA